MNLLPLEEIFPIVDEEGNTIGRAPRSVCHDGKTMLLHPVVHLHLFNYKGDLFLQKRSLTKDIQPGKWDTSVGGHVGLDESIEHALLRESEEELGLTGFNPEFLGRYVWESSREMELVTSFSTISDKVVLFNKSEIDEARFWSLEEIKESIGQDIFTPNFEYEFALLITKKTS